MFFNRGNKNLMKYFIEKNSYDTGTNIPNQIPLLVTSKYYSQLVMFDYIGVKYFNF